MRVRVWVRVGVRVRVWVRVRVRVEVGGLDPCGSCRTASAWGRAC